MEQYIEEMIKKMERIFGPIARKMGEEAKKESRNVKEFETKFIEKMSRITGNRQLIENIIHGV